jgi:sugar transferase (PEP-CTERM/EpsH1 system associated)
LVVITLERGKRRALTADNIRVTHVIRSLEFGGAEAMVLRLAELQKRMATVEPSLICMKSLGPLRGEAERLGLETTLVGTRGVKYFSGIARLVRLLTHRKPDIVHTHNLVAHTHAAPAAKLLGIPIVHTKHGRQVTSFRRLPVLRRLLYGLSDRTAVVSRDTGESLSSKVRIDPAKTVVVYNGIDVGRYTGVDRLRARSALGLDAEATVFGTVSRLDRVKDHPTMLRAFTKTTHNRDEGIMLIVGDGPERERIERLVSELGIGERVLMPGFSHDVPSMLACMDMYLQPSTEEGLSLTILEAAAAGLPVVSTKVGGTPEIITDGESGVLIDPGDVEALAATMERFFNDRDPFDEMAARGRKRIESLFSLEGMTARYEDIYRDVLRERVEG